MLKVGVIGLGVGNQHLIGYSADPRVKLAAVCDFDGQKTAEAVKAYPGVRAVASADEMLADPSIDAVSIASYDDFHAEQVLAAIRGNKHIFVEKPLCLHRREAESIRAALKRNPRIVMGSNLILRMEPLFQDLHRRVRGGELGDIFHLEGDYLYGRLHKITEGWRADMDFYSVTLGGGIHLIDLLMWVLGRDVIEVSAISNDLSSRGSKFRYPDLVSAFLRFEGGVTAKVSANFGCVLPHFHSVSVFGTKATFLNQHGAARIFTSRDKTVAPETLKIPYPDAPKYGLLPDFIEKIMAGFHPSSSVLATEDEVFKSLAVCFAIDESAATGRPVKVSTI